MAAKKKSTPKPPRPERRTDAGGRSGMGESARSNISAKAGQPSSASFKTAMAAAEEQFQKTLNRMVMESIGYDYNKNRTNSPSSNVTKKAAPKKATAQSKQVTSRTEMAFGRNTPAGKGARGADTNFAPAKKGDYPTTQPNMRKSGKATPKKKK